MALNDCVGSQGAPLLAPDEQVFFQSRANVALEMAAGTGYPGSTGTFVIGTGGVIITSANVYYTATPPLPMFQTLRVPLENLQDVTLGDPQSGLFGNVRWLFGLAPAAPASSVRRSVTALVYPIPGGEERVSTGSPLTEPSTIRLNFDDGTEAVAAHAAHRQLHLRLGETLAALEDQPPPPPDPLPLYSPQ